MLKSKCMLMYFFYLVVSSYAASVPFIDKCLWKDKACLVSSSQKALPFFADGLQDMGLSPLDPLNLIPVSINEGGLNVVFKDVIVTGVKQCKILEVERNNQEGWLTISANCPISADGKYSASGKLLFVPVEGDGPFQVKTKKVYISVKVKLDVVDGKDGQKYWKISKPEYTYEFKEKAYMTFDNLFNGDQEKSAPILKLFDQNWKELVQSIGQPIVKEVVHGIFAVVQKFVEKVPASDLEQL